MERQLNDKKGIIKINKGITLIALVITIIVLLILAGVSIATLSGPNGILGQANSAKVETRAGAVQEARDLWKSNKEADVLAGTSTAQTLDELLADLEKQKLLTSEEVAIVKETGSVTIGSKTIEFGTGGMTLVEMFKKAEADHCLNLDGTCQNEEHLHIGDYVDYKNPTSGTYTITAEKSGLNNPQKADTSIPDQTYDVSKNQLNWRVLGIDEATGGLKLIAGSPMKLNNIEGKDDPYLYLDGAEAYEYGPSEMDKVGALYKNEYAQSARSVKIEDINQVLGIKTEDDIKNNNIFAMQGIIQYGESYGPFENQYTPNSWLNGKQTTTVQGKAYWLASRGVLANPDDDYARFGPGVVDGGDGIAIASVGFNTFKSVGDEYDDGFAVRPVVSLKSEITKDEVPKIADKTEEEWHYEMPE